MIVTESTPPPAFVKQTQCLMCLIETLIELPFIVWWEADEGDGAEDDASQSSNQ